MGYRILVCGLNSKRINQSLPKNTQIRQIKPAKNIGKPPVFMNILLSAYAATLVNNKKN
jgi:hypothetical protein